MGYDINYTEPFILNITAYYNLGFKTNYLALVGEEYDQLLSSGFELVRKVGSVRKREGKNQLEGTYPGLFIQESGSESYFLQDSSSGSVFVTIYQSGSIFFTFTRKNKEKKVYDPEFYTVRGIMNKISETASRIIQVLTRFKQ